MEKTVLRFIGDRNVRRYLTPKEARAALGYPQSCLEEWQGDAEWDDMIGMSNAVSNYEPSRWERLRPNQGLQCFARLLICDRGLEVIYKADSELLLNDDDSSPSREAKLADLRSKVQLAIAGKIIVGYNLGFLLSNLQINHSRFIDIAHLYPEVTPKKQSLCRLAKEILGVYLSRDYKYHYGRGARGYRERDRMPDPDSSDEDRGRDRRDERRDERDTISGGEEFVASSESANVCLKIAEKHIEEGRGILCTLPARKADFHNVDEMLKQAEISKEAVCGLFLRGSRALDIQINNEEYTSDWDYVCVMDTTAVINSVLVRLPEVDLLLFDRRSFQIYVNGGDMPMIQLFFLPSHCIHVNRLPLPIVSLRNSKYSLIHHLKKADEKIAYYSTAFYNTFQPDRQYTQQPSTREERPARGRRTRSPVHNHELLEIQGSRAASNDDPKYVKWKFIKVMHMQVRFLDLYLQIKQKGRIINPLAQTAFWKRLEAICLNQGHFAAYQVCKDEFNRILSHVFTHQELQYHAFHLYKAEADSHMPDTCNRRRRGRGERRRDQRRRGGYPYRSYSRREQVDYQILSIYRRSNAISSEREGGQIHRINDVEEEVNCMRGSQFRFGSNSSRQPKLVLLNTTALDNAVWKQSPFLKLFIGKINQNIGQIQNQFDSASLEPRQFYSIRYMQEQGQQPLEDDLACLTNFIPQENANMEAAVVQEASACIMRSYLTELQEKTAVYTLVCYMYKPFQEYASIRADTEAVSAFEGREFDVFEKRDGVLTALYFSGAGWVVGSKRTPDARERITPGEDVTISDEFSRVFSQLGYRLPQEKHRQKTFLFELLSTKITNTLPKSKDELILHGVRNLRTLEEEDPEYYAGQYGWTHAPILVLKTKSLEEIAQLAESRRDCEGFILRDTDYNRLIIRNPSVLRKKWEKELKPVLQEPKYGLLIDANRKAFFLYSQIVLRNRHQEYLQIFPEDQQVVQGILAYIQEVRGECLRLKEQIGERDWEETEVDELISDKRIDILTYLLNSRMRQQQGLFQVSLHTSISFSQAFAFLLQYLHNRTPALS